MLYITLTWAYFNHTTYEAKRTSKKDYLAYEYSRLIGSTQYNTNEHQLTSTIRLIRQTVLLQALQDSCRDEA
jgi:hypothetical protein